MLTLCLCRAFYDRAPRSGIILSTLSPQRGRQDVTSKGYAILRGSGGDGLGGPRFAAREITGSVDVLRRELDRIEALEGAAGVRPVALEITGLGVLGLERREALGIIARAGGSAAPGTDAMIVIGSVEACRRAARGLDRKFPDLAASIRTALDARRPRELVARGRSEPLGERTLIMGILNLSPDSFSGDGLDDPDAAVAQAQRFLDCGADILDVGAMSTRPGSAPIPEEVEAGRLGAVIRAIRPLTGGIISADTYRLGPAAAALEAGADVINDISGLRDPALARLAAGYGAGVVVMHMQGTPATMQDAPAYEDVVGEVYGALASGAGAALEAGIAPEGIVVDPGIGFGKTLEHNLELLQRLREFTGLGYPLLVGASRKGFIGRITGREVGDRLHGTAATVALSVAGGADIVRVHDVEEMALVVRMSDAIVRRGSRTGSEAHRPA